MTIGIVAGVFVALVIWWLQELDREFDREKVDEKIRREQEREQEQESRDVRESEAELEYAMLSLEIRSDAYLDRLDEVVARNNMQIEQLKRSRS